MSTSASIPSPSAAPASPPSARHESAAPPLTPGESAAPPLTLAVIVPTFQRVPDLQRCLAALLAQTRPADQILVVVRDTDDQTRQFLSNAAPAKDLPLVTVTVAEPGVVAAMSRAVDAAQTDIVAITDDDAAPWPDWLARTEAHFRAAPRVGGVGGRDWMRNVPPLEFGAHKTDKQNSVGTVRWFGRVSGDHHLGEGRARTVDVLKGVCCAYRTPLLRQAGFDGRLWGRGAQVHWELALGYAIRAQGYTLLYDPAVCVDHFLGPRQDEDQRVFAFHAEAHVNSVHNETLILLEHMTPVQRVVFLAWALLVGTRHAPGLLQVGRLWFKRQPHVWPYFLATLAGRRAGLHSFWKYQHASKKYQHP